MRANYILVVFDLHYRPTSPARTVEDMTTAAMQTPDGRWRVEVGGVGVVRWYRLVGPDTTVTLPSIDSLADRLDRHGVDLAELQEAT